MSSQEEFQLTIEGSVENRKAFLKEFLTTDQIKWFCPHGYDTDDESLDNLTNDDTTCIHAFNRNRFYADVIDKLLKKYNIHTAQMVCFDRDHDQTFVLRSTKESPYLENNDEETFSFLHGYFMFLGEERFEEELEERIDTMHDYYEDEELVEAKQNLILECSDFLEQEKLHDLINNTLAAE